MLCWFVAPLLVGRAVLVRVPPLARACCVGARLPRWWCLVCVVAARWVGSGCGCVVALAGVGAVLVRAPPLDGACRACAWPPPWWGVLRWFVAPLLLGRAVLVAACRGGGVWFGLSPSVGWVVVAVVLLAWPGLVLCWCVPPPPLPIGACRVCAWPPPLVGSAVSACSGFGSLCCSWLDARLVLLVRCCLHRRTAGVVGCWLSVVFAWPGLVLCWCLPPPPPWWGALWVCGPPLGGACCVGSCPPSCSGVLCWCPPAAVVVFGLCCRRPLGGLWLRLCCWLGRGWCCAGTCPPPCSGVPCLCVPPPLVGRAVFVCGPPPAGACCVGGRLPRWWCLVWVVAICLVGCGRGCVVGLARVGVVLVRPPPPYWGVPCLCVAPPLVGSAVSACSGFGSLCCSQLDPRLVLLARCCLRRRTAGVVGCCLSVVFAWPGLVLCWCVPPPLVGRAVLVCGPPLGGACCVGTCPPSCSGVLCWCPPAAMVVFGLCCRRPLGGLWLRLCCWLDRGWCCAVACPPPPLLGRAVFVRGRPLVGRAVSACSGFGSWCCGRLDARLVLLARRCLRRRTAGVVGCLLPVVFAWPGLVLCWCVPPPLLRRAVLVCAPPLVERAVGVFGFRFVVL